MKQTQINRKLPVMGITRQMLRVGIGELLFYVGADIALARDSSIGTKTNGVALTSAAADPKKQLQREITRAKKNADALWTAAGKINDLSHIGTMYNEVDLKEHTCHVLGRLLKFEKYIGTVTIKYNPDFKTRSMENAQALRIMGTSMRNFASVASAALGENEGQWAMAWNLDCAGKMGIPHKYANVTTSQVFYTVRNNGSVIHVLGDIEPGFSKKLEEVLEANPSVETVALGSGGGSVYEALKAGYLIRSKSLKTTLWNSCYSACPLVFIGGVERTIWSPYPKFGFHQVSISGVAIPLNSKIYRDIGHYGELMGVDATWLLNNMFVASPSSMNAIKGDDVKLCEARIVHWVQRGCSAKSL